MSSHRDRRFARDADLNRQPIPPFPRKESGMSSFPDHHLPRKPVSSNNDAHSWRDILKRALEQSTWKRSTNHQSEPSDAVKTSSSFSLSRSSSRAPKVLVGL